MADEQPGQTSPGLPRWVIFGGLGVGAVVLFLYVRRKGATAATTQAPLVPAVATDPNTGAPLDPLTGLPYVTSQPSTTGTTPDLSSWINQAEQALVAHGYTPALASQSLYDYTNENQLTAQEAGAVNRALGLIGFAPGPPLPFLGTPPAPPKPAAPAAVKLPPWVLRFLSPRTYATLAPAQRRDWREVRWPSGRTGYVPQGSALPSGARWYVRPKAA